MDTVEKSIREEFKEAIEFYKYTNKSETPQYNECISKFDALTKRQASNYRERNLICNSKAYMAQVRTNQAQLNYKIPNNAIQYLEASIKCYEQLIYDKEHEMDKKEAEIDPHTQHYNVALSCQRLGSIKEDQYSTDQSYIHVNPSMKRLPNARVDYFKAIEAINAIPYENLEIRDLNLLGVTFLRLKDRASALMYIDRALKSEIQRENEDIQPSAKLEPSYAIFNDDYYVTRSENEYSGGNELDDYLMAVFNKGYILYTERKFHEAREYFYDYYSHDQEDHEVLTYLGDTYLNLNDYYNALSFYFKSKQSRTGMESLNGIALCYLFLDKLTDASAYARESLSIVRLDTLLSKDCGIPYDKIDSYTKDGKRLIVESLCISSTVFLKTEDKESAFVIIEKAKTIAQRYALEMASPFFLQGIMLMENKNFSKARKCFDELVEIKKNFAEAFNFLGICHHNIGNTQEGIEMIKRAIEVKPEMASVHVNLYRLESYENKNVDVGNYWTRSRKREAILVGLIVIGLLAFVHGFLYPDEDNTITTTSNYTAIENGTQKEISQTSTEKQISNNNQVRLAIIIGIIIIILWPSIRSIKLGTSTLEIEKLSYVEEKEQIYLSWIKVDQVLHRSAV